jgi:tRNA pseudouridine55 synthase
MISEAHIAPSGLLLYDKPPGVTSFAALGAIKRALGTKKVGHTGTLDSFATGLLVVLVGPLTHLVSHITSLDKTYSAVIRFGSETDTLDPTGVVVREAPLPSPAAVRDALPLFLGPIMQVPPAYSAIHVEGKRASDLMRSGTMPEMAPRAVTIHHIAFQEVITGETGGLLEAVIEVRCSKGTYIRSLARDMGKAVGSAAHLAALRRTAVGDFRVDEALRAAQTEKMKAGLLRMTPELAKRCGLGVRTLVSDGALANFRQGRRLDDDWFIPGAFPVARDVGFAVFSLAGDFAGLVYGNGKYGFVVH